MTIEDLAFSIQKNFLHFEEKFNKRFDAMDARFDAMDTRFDKMDTRFDRADARFERLESMVIGDHRPRIRALEKKVGI